jgi:hypothetical protein
MIYLPKLATIAIVFAALASFDVVEAHAGWGFSYNTGGYVPAPVYAYPPPAYAYPPSGYAYPPPAPAYGYPAPVYPAPAYYPGPVVPPVNLWFGFGGYGPHYHGRRW